MPPLHPVRQDQSNALPLSGQAGWIDLELDDGSIVHLKVESCHGKLRDAFTVSSFLGHLLRRPKRAHPAYRPVPA